MGESSILRLLLVAALSGALAYAGGFAILTSGARVYAERFEVRGDKILLHNRGGVTEMAASSIDHVEPEDRPLDELLPPASTLPTLPPPPIRQAAVERPDIASLIAQAAERHGLPREFALSVAAAESRHNPRAVSPKGAIGVMQLMPDTARALGANPHDLHENIDAGVRYLRSLLIKYGYHPELALAAYNAGPAAVDKHGGIPPYRETHSYIRTVMRRYEQLNRTAN